MKMLIATLVILGALAFVQSASAQYVTNYSARTIVTPVDAVPVTTYYAPVRVVTYRSVVTPVYSNVTVYRAEGPVLSAPVVTAVPVAPVVVYGRPVYSHVSRYGGLEVRVPGHPIRNAVRTVVP